jgi:hypothetical protein
VDYDYNENWGLAGIGNKAIAERVAECNIRHKFKKGDVVIVQWTSHLRNDWYHIRKDEESPGGWKTRGSIFNYINEKIYDRKWIEHFFWEPAYLMHSLNVISLTQGLLESTGVTWFMTGMGDLRNMGTDVGAGGGYGEHISLSKEDMEKIHLLYERVPEFKIYNKSIWEDRASHWLTPLVETIREHKDLTYSFIDTSYSKNPVSFQDFHPTPKQHIIWLKENLQDKLDIPENLFTNSNIIAGTIDALQQKFKRDKRLFEHMVYKREFFPEEANNLNWPTKYMGF